MGSTMKIRNVLRCAAEQTTTIDDIYGWPEADHNKPNGYIISRNGEADRQARQDNGHRDNRGFFSSVVALIQVKLTSHHCLLMMSDWTGL